MNYNVLLLGGTLILAVFYYVIWGKHHYLGPVVEVDPEESKKEEHIHHL